MFRLMLKKNIIHGQKFSSESLMCFYNNFAIKFSTHRDFKHFYFNIQIQPVLFVHALLNREKPEKIKEMYIS